MRTIFLPDVGDGLCVGLFTFFDECIQIDWGGNKNAVNYNPLRERVSPVFSPNRFILSHFHLDHYNGLLYHSKLTKPPTFPYFDFQKVYYPKIPEFPRKKEFIMELFSINIRVFGDSSGQIDYDFLEALRKINNHDFEYMPLSQGDEVNVKGSVFKVIWPPKAIDDKISLRKIEKASQKFEKIMKEDEHLAEIYKRVGESGIFEKLEKGGRDESVYHNTNRKHSDNDITRKDYNIEKRRKLPENIREVNKAYRDAANQISLAFCEDNRLLFMGDVGGNNLRRLIEYLDYVGHLNFLFLITPHHGTEWHDNLRKLQVNFSLTSNGPNKIKKYRTEYKEISKLSLTTYVNGDLLYSLVPRHAGAYMTHI